jgi:hypothetical protein
MRVTRGVRPDFNRPHQSTVGMVEDVTVKHPAARPRVEANDDAHGFAVRHVDGSAIPASNAAAGALVPARIDAMASADISNARHALLRDMSEFSTRA